MEIDTKTHRLLTLGEELQEGDEAWTWVDPECTKLGWFRIEMKNLGKGIIDEGHVPVRRALHREIDPKKFAHTVLKLARDEAVRQLRDLGIDVVDHNKNSLHATETTLFCRAHYIGKIAKDGLSDSMSDGALAALEADLQIVKGALAGRVNDEEVRGIFCRVQHLIFGRKGVTRRAYLMVRLDITGVIPMVTNVTTASSSANQMTCMRGEIYADVYEVEGKSFQEASDKLLSDCRQFAFLKWALPWIDKGYEAHMKQYDYSQYAKMIAGMVARPKTQ